MNMRESLFTIGHSTHSLKRFISLLKQQGVTALCDVRSTPYSRFNTQFNREGLKNELKAVGIAYVFLGKELGARSDDPCCYEHGKVQYDRLANTALFRDGLNRVQEGMKKYRIALMCAEREPLECHRTILVSRHLANLDIEVQHIHADGTLESHKSATKRLLRLHNLHEKEMFRSEEELLVTAYKLQEDRIAYSQSPIPDAEEISIRNATG